MFKVILASSSFSVVYVEASFHFNRQLVSNGSLNDQQKQ